MSDKEAMLRKKILRQQKSLALFDIILQNVDYGIFVNNADGDVVYENKLAIFYRQKYFEHKRRFLDRQGQNIPYDLLPYTMVFEDQKVHSAIMEVETKAREAEKWFHVRAVPVFNKRKKLAYVVRTWKEVTHRIMEERRREHFIAIGSHELRTPLAGIKALNQVLSKFYYEKKYDKARSFFHKIDNKVNLLTKIIQDFIEVEKIRGGKLEFSPESFNFDEMATSTILEMGTIYKSHKIRKYGSADVTIIADKERIYEVFVNLITNALKYSPTSDKIDVRVNSDEKKITVGVRDYGIGMSKENISNIFEPFYRVKDPDTEKVHGLGLGLYIAFKIIELHGGRMWVISKKGEGSTFYFSIPRIIRKTKKQYEF